MPRPVRIIGVPLDLGQAKRGVDMGASAVRYAGLGDELRRLGLEVRDSGDLPVPLRELVGDGHAERMAAIRSVCAETCAAAQAAVAEGLTPIFLGGDHTIAVGSIAGITAAGRTGVIWVDAHGDFNTPDTSPSGNPHGMALAALLGDGDPDLVAIGRPGAKLAATDVVLIGLRSVDAEEKLRLRASGITLYTMRDIDERGMGAIAREALARLEHCERLHVSFDIDAIDPQEAPGAGTRVPGGLTYREAQLLMEIIADRGGVDSLDLVEINPILDVANRSARLAVELAASLFGKRIL